MNEYFQQLWNPISSISNQRASSSELKRTVEIVELSKLISVRNSGIRKKLEKLKKLQNCHSQTKTKKGFNFQGLIIMSWQQSSWIKSSIYEDPKWFNLMLKDKRRIRRAFGVVHFKRTTFWPWKSQVRNTIRNAIKEISNFSSIHFLFLDCLSWLNSCESRFSFLCFCAQKTCTASNSRLCFSFSNTFDLEVFTKDVFCWCMTNSFWFLACTLSDFVFFAWTNILNSRLHSFLFSLLLMYLSLFQFNHGFAYWTASKKKTQIKRRREKSKSKRNRSGEKARVEHRTKRKARVSFCCVWFPITRNASM